MKRIIVGITGASGVIYGIRLLEVLKELGVESHLILSDSAKKNFSIETDYSIAAVEKLAHTVHDDNLIIRAADVVLKERRRLILLIRETPLHKGHLEMLVRVADLGGIILPPIPAFYHHPKRIEDIIDHSIGKMLDLLDIEHSLYQRWKGES
jgi:4-hydroxy-3-polyprenylbenzoate decarboxylase